ncbi:uncharacterized protein L3040_007155 [Drepanopeziza brunnea f. sp. 'multigermtubi']|uniref:uncharacterized protein n=1 Tax=Drepanopeziza brunnea f. sp. 'multigermtubi' TaxID=698441 RepID=UPI0023A454BE|nr:hypothetical protein L3040_007155 [Drepanopeziza brunnea f. sp. 'multigermtubi']
MISLFVTFVSLSALPFNVHAQNSSATNEPCAQVSAMVVPMRAANPSVTPMIPGELAINCLRSVPLNSEQALAVTNALMPYVEFQSDLSYKAAPPAGYPYPAIDLVGQVNRIASSIQNNTYPNEHAWQTDMFTTFMAAKDGHFRFAGDLIVRPVRFTRNVSLVSVSMDGTSMPQIYLTDEILAMNTNTTGAAPSPVAQINGQDAVAFMNAEANKGFQQDPDAAYNTVMYNPALDFTPGMNVRGFFAGDGRYGFYYPGPNTTLTFANGTTTTYQTQALVPGNFSGVTDGATAFQRFCVPPVATAPQDSPANQAPAPMFRAGDPTSNNTRLKGYPIAQVSSSDGQISGYYLPNSDVGVIAMNSFEPDVPAEFQAVMQTMLAEMKRDGKTKLVVDLQGNGGGIVVNGFDAFRQLFPTTQDQVFARQRSGPTYATLTQTVSDQFANFTVQGSSDFTRISLFQSAFNVGFDLNQNRTAFSSLAEKFGPYPINGDQFSGLQQNNFEDPDFTSSETTGAGMDVTGYGARKNFTQPFPAANIVMLYDGTCASTCTLFSEMMRNQGGVKSVALGGRPGTSQIQAIGGVKGAQSLSFGPLFRNAQFFLQPATVPNALATSAQKTVFQRVTDLPQNRSLDNGINFSDHILAPNVPDGVPAQFVREDADCRLFYTPAMMQNVTAMWQAAADAAFNGKPCVAGGISMPKDVTARALPQTTNRQVAAAMVQAASNARTYLQEVQGKAAMAPTERSPMWKEMNGKAIPSMYMA